MQNQKISINISKNNYMSIEAIANIMEISVEKLTMEALESFLYTVKEHLRGIDEHVFPQQIMFE